MQDTYTRVTRNAITPQQLAEKLKCVRASVLSRVEHVQKIEPFLIRAAGIKAAALLAMYMVDTLVDTGTSKILARLFTTEPDLPASLTDDQQVKKVSPGELVGNLVKALSPAQDLHFAEVDSLANVLSRTMQWDLINAKLSLAAPLQRLACQLYEDILSVHGQAVSKAEEHRAETETKDAACKTAGTCGSCGVSSLCSDNVAALSAGWNDKALAALEWGSTRIQTFRSSNW